MYNASWWWFLRLAAKIGNNIIPQSERLCKSVLKNFGLICPRFTDTQSKLQWVCRRLPPFQVGRWWQVLQQPKQIYTPHMYKYTSSFIIPSNFQGSTSPHAHKKIPAKPLFYGNKIGCGDGIWTTWPSSYKYDLHILHINSFDKYVLDMQYIHKLTLTSVLQNEYRI